MSPTKSISAESRHSVHSPIGVRIICQPSITHETILALCRRVPETGGINTEERGVVEAHSNLCSDNDANYGPAPCARWVTGKSAKASSRFAPVPLPSDCERRGTGSGSVTARHALNRTIICDHSEQQS
ncbi:lipoxygenase [Anopheles sinensis]|uniref:Lipoxygenase n=1 Tax=Anopheles sinensis TaxID=74873 RepID=A0A084VSZ1_ANOSI|nr:lipoxygenase [Anopheles sinensis]